MKKLLLTLLGLAPLAAQVSLPPAIVTAARAPQPPAEVPFSLVALDAATLRSAPTATLDGALRGVPGFGLFRRSDSLSANPTAQGVSLRGLGPSGASRSLVLLDGVPLNDPFGGWVAWSKAPRLSLAGAELVKGGGATAWGNAALGGVVQLFTTPVGPALAAGPHPGVQRSAGQRRPDGLDARFAATGGDFATRSAEVVLSRAVGRGAIELSGRAFATDGFALVAPEDRGPIDIPAPSRHRWLAARWRQPVGNNGELTVSARTFAESRNNGTPYQQNASDENFGAITLTAQPDKSFTWTATAYGQDQDFASTFSAVNATRTAETPASDQFSVPAVALGAAWTGIWSHGGNARTSGGADLRRVRGETHEHFTFSNGGFTRLRGAGGQQDFVGMFALHERSLAADLRATFGARLDWWRESDGHRDETDRATGASLRHERHAARDGIEFSPSAGVVWQAAKEWRVRAAAQHAFRRPTLNELYRPFRVGNVITEANAALETERVLSGEVGVEWSHDREPTAAEQSRALKTGSPLPPIIGTAFGATVFWNEFRDAVGNVTLVSGPGTFPLFGFIPAGGAGRQRLNLDRLRVQGFELSARWQPHAWLGFTADYLRNDATVRRATASPGIEGNRLAQVPRHSATLGAHWRLWPSGLTLTPRLRWLDRQFEDDENLLRLGAAVVLDLGVTAPCGEIGEFFLHIENLADARIETGRTAAGLVNTGAPRLVFGGWRTTW